MHSIVVPDVPESDMQELREEAASRNISVNDVVLEIIRNGVEVHRKLQTQSDPPQTLP